MELSTTHNYEYEKRMREPNPLVSFIITTYNLPAKLLTDCLSSILSLSLSKEEREIIVIDDGSNIPAIYTLQEFTDAIIYIRQPNKGLSVARNMGIKVSSGSFIQFVDGDDFLHRVAYEHCLDIVRYHDPELVMFATSSNPESETPFTIDGPIVGSTYMHHHNIKGSACGYIFNRSTLAHLRFTPHILHEDEEFTPLLLLKCERVFLTNAKAYHYRKRKDSITHTNTLQHKVKALNDMENILYRLQETANRLPVSEQIALQRRISQLTMDYLYQTIKQTQSEEHLTKAIKELKRHGLFPLPHKDYTWKYTFFRRLINHKMGRKLLLNIGMMR